MSTEKHLQVRLIIATKTDAEWSALNPVVRKGELVFSSDLNWYKIGDGTKTWSNLPYNKNTPLIQGTQSTVTNLWTGNADFGKLVDGQEITYWLPLNSKGNPTLNLTLSDGTTTTGAKDIYIGGSIKLDNRYIQGSAIHLTYRENVKIPSTGSTTYTGWWVNTDYDDEYEYNAKILGLKADFINLTVERVAGASGKSQGSDFDSFRMYGNRKKCNVADGGAVLAYYGDTEYTETGLTEVEITKDGTTYPIGTQVQVMIEQPKFYYKVVPIETEPQTGKGCIGSHLNKAIWYISDECFPGFKIHPAFIGYDLSGKPELDKIYIAAYEACAYDVSEGKYITDDSQTVDFTNDKLSSIAGVKPMSGLTQQCTRPNVEKIAQNRGIEWHSQDIRVVSMEQLLMIIELGTFDTQSDIGRGVVDMADPSPGYNCSAQTGSTASLGNGTGRATSTTFIINGVTTTETANGKTSICYRGRENFYGNIYKFVYGVNIKGNGGANGGIPYICTDYNYQESRTIGNYESVGFTIANSSHYIKTFGYAGEKYDWIFLASRTSTSSSSLVKDYFYVTANLGNGTFRIAPLGGTWSYSSYAGAFFWALNSAVGARYRIIGGSL